MLTIIDAFSQEKHIDREIVFQAMEEALALATAKQTGKQYDERALIRVEIDRDTGAYRSFRRWRVIDRIDGPPDDPGTEVNLSEARDLDPEAQPGEFLEAPIESVEFGRVDIQIAKQTLFRKIKEVERTKLAAAFLDKVGQNVTGTVKRFERGDIIIDLGNDVEAILPQSETLPRQTVRFGDRVKANLKEIVNAPGGPLIVLSRTSAEFMVGLISAEVPEMIAGAIDVAAAVREPGVRAKVALMSLDGQTDPVGTCIGMRGARIQAVCNELGDEKIELCLWDEDPVQFAINAIAPGEVVSVLVDEKNQSMDIATTEATLAKAIGRNGLNVKLASDLTGWTLNVMGAAQAEAYFAEESRRLAEFFVESLKVDAAVATRLVDEGFTRLDEVIHAPIRELLSIDGINESLAEELRRSATEAVAKGHPVTIEDFATIRELMRVDGVDPVLAGQVTRKGIRSIQDIGDLATDELMEIAGIPRDQASRIILSARQLDDTVDLVQR